jgi:O-antigen ligase
VKLLLVSAIVVFTGAIVVSLSRGGFLGFCAVVLYCVARSPRKMAGFIVVAIIGLALAFFAGSEYWNEMSTITDTSEATADTRLEIWQIGLRMWGSNPVFGVGPGNFRWQSGDYQSAEQLEKFGRSLQGSIVAHSLPVELLAELGTTGAIVVVALVLGAWRELRHVRRDMPRPTAADPGDRWVLRCYAEAVTCSILACMVTGIFLSLLYLSYLWLLIALASAIFQVFRAETGGSISPSDNKFSKSAWKR